MYEFRFINNWFEICYNNQSYILIDITYFKPIINESEVWLHHSLYLAYNWGNFATKLVSKSSDKITFCQLYYLNTNKINLCTLYDVYNILQYRVPSCTLCN